MNYYLIADNGWVTKFEGAKDYNEAFQSAEEQGLTDADSPNWIIADETAIKVIVKAIKELSK